MFIEQTDSLEKEKHALSQELEEKREMEEFKSLEEEFRKEQEVMLLISFHTIWTEFYLCTYMFRLCSFCLCDLTG